MKQYLLLFFVVFGTYGHTMGQVTTVPLLPRADEPVTITVDATGSGLDVNNYTGDVYLWSWINEGCTSNCDAPTNVNPATAAQAAAKMTRISENVYSITITPTQFFNKPASEILEIGVIAKAVDWSQGQTADAFIEMLSGDIGVSIIAPEEPLFLESGQSITITTAASEVANLNLKINNTTVASEASATTLDYIFTAGAAGKYEIQIEADNGVATAIDSTYIIVPSATVAAPRPAGVIPGINYINESTVILDLWAPLKSSAYVVGEFTNWEIDPAFQMKQDGEHFWIRIEGLEPGKEYGFQYLVDEDIYIADAYADKILDPLDEEIPASVYPGLQPYPEQALRSPGVLSRVSVLQTAQQPYQWESEPKVFAKDSLIIYELLIRDFFANGERSYQNLIDTLSYLNELGINAIELMPVMEFNSNNSWGYNPTFMFAPDKYYGPKEDLKRFIDEAHKLNMAVILDIAVNHNDIPNSFLAMYFDYTNYKPTAENPFFNVNATHPFNVFYDFNHESPYTQAYLDSINEYWIKEYRIDGFRYDLSKGFTQTVSGDNVGAWSAYDASRIALLKRMKDEIDEYAPNALLILEHFADNTEERELANYGFLLWGNLNHNYSQAAMGYASGAAIDWGYYETRGWNENNLVTYMTSHDEERVAYRLKEFGNSTSTYNTKALDTRMERLKEAAVFLYTLPGPKMMWQWEEWGYDIAIDVNGRTGIKPLPWNNVDGLDYGNVPERRQLYEFYKALLNMRRMYPVFSFGDAEVKTLNNNILLKQITVLNSNYTNNPTSPEQMNAVVVGNFDLQARDVTAQFPHSGMWYSYFAPSSPLEVPSTQETITLGPGEFRIYTDISLPEPEAELTVFSDPNEPAIIALEEMEEQGIQISWMDNSEIESGFRILRSADGVTFTEVGSVQADVTTFLDTEVSANTTYYYQVEAFGTSGFATSPTEEIVVTNVVTSVSLDKAGLKYYPNPVSDRLTIEFQKPYQVNIYDVRGNLIYQSISQSGKQNISTQNMPAGLYSIQILAEGELHNFKIVKN